MRRLTLLALPVLLCAVLLSTGLLTAQQNRQPAPVTQNARWLQAQINAWRIELGLGPLAWNDTLAHMAADQAAFAASWTEIPDNLHAGRNGEGPRVRALYPEYGWPTYGGPEQVVVGEIAWFGTREDAMAFWHESTIHRQTATNPRYREIGIGEVPRKDGHGSYFYAVLGGRPDVLPAVANPEAGILYLTNESGARAGDWMRSATQVRLFDGSGRPLGDDWRDWQPTLPLPDAGDAVYVLYSDGQREVMTRASLLPRDIPLPNYETSWSAFAAQLGPAATQAPTLTPTPPPPPHIRLIYDRNFLTLVNLSLTRADVRAMVLEAADGTRLAIRDLTAAFVRGSLSALPLANCLRAGPENRNPPGEPLCRYSSQTYLPASRLIWRQDFRVLLGETEIARCSAAEGECEFDLPLP